MNIQLTQPNDPEITSVPSRQTPHPEAVISTRTDDDAPSGVKAQSDRRSPFVQDIWVRGATGRNSSSFPVDVTIHRPVGSKRSIHRSDRIAAGSRRIGILGPFRSQR